MNTEHVVIWDGSHRGTDDDLLCVPSITVKRLGTAADVCEQDALGRSKPPKAVYDAHFAAARKLMADGAWWSTSQLAGQLGVSRSVVARVIQRLRRKQLIQRGRPAKRSNATGLVVYRLRANTVAA